jgi:hypothetical protein
VLTLNHRTRLFGVALVALAYCAPAVAQDYPSRPVTLIIPFPAGGGVDTIGRVIAAKLTAALGQQVIVENRAGAGSVIGIRAAAKAAPDGYTILIELRLLERATHRGGRDTVDHPRNGSDDLANALCGAAVLARKPAYSFAGDWVDGPDKPPDDPKQQQQRVRKLIKKLMRGEPV